MPNPVGMWCVKVGKTYGPEHTITIDNITCTGPFTEIVNGVMLLGAISGRTAEQSREYAEYICNLINNDK